MPLRLEDYALIGDTHSAALVGRDGSIDWLCWPRFDSPSCFGALLGDERHGRWLLAPAGGVRRVRRRYRPDTLVLETDFETEEGALRVVDCMPPRGKQPDVVRLVQGLAGRVPVRMELAVRFGYGDRSPWVRSGVHGICAAAGPDSVLLRSGVPGCVEDHSVRATLWVEPGQCVPFVLTWYPSHEPPPSPVEPFEALAGTEAWWRAWSGQCRCEEGPFEGDVRLSLRVLKALTYSPTGGIVAAPTTSLPEQPGGVRNWDYRYCWLRDATLTLTALLHAGYREEARAWRDWLLRAVAGEPEELQIMYGVAGERWLPEWELPWLPGYEGARPVRIGNGAARQLQLDVYGEVMDCLHQARRAGLEPGEDAWRLQRHLLEWLEGHWDEADEGLWEVRGPPQHFTHSRLMAWVALDRAVQAVEAFGLPGPLERWRALRARIHQDVCEQGWDARRGAFTQAYGRPALDASLLMMPLVGFLPAHDPRVVGTVEAIQRELCEDGLVHRYDSSTGHDGLPPGEGVFLACSFWLVDCLTLLGRAAEAHALFERLRALANDVGLLSEEYHPRTRRLVGNFPQAFSHLALVSSAQNLSRAHGPAAQRARS